MRYEDVTRPYYDSGGTQYPLHLSGAPLPSITLVRPMESEGPENAEGTREWVWGWLCCIHAARGANSFSHYYCWIGDLARFQAEFFEDPEAALAKYFKWKGLEEPPRQNGTRMQVIEQDIFGAGD
jgi:hypothetical protein